MAAGRQFNIIQPESHLVEYLYCYSRAIPLHTRKIWAICSATTHQRCLFVGCESGIIKHQHEHCKEAWYAESVESVESNKS